jgi:hypothetical protein
MLYAELHRIKICQQRRNRISKTLINLQLLRFHEAKWRIRTEETRDRKITLLDLVAVQ